MLDARLAKFSSDKGQTWRMADVPKTLPVSLALNSQSGKKRNTKRIRMPVHDVVEICKSQRRGAQKQLASTLLKGERTEVDGAISTI